MKIFSKIRGPVQKILASLKTETEIAHAITYKRYSGQTLVDRKPVNAYDSISITSLRMRHSEDTLKGLGLGAESDIQQGDIIYLIDARDFPTGTSLKDKILNGTNWEQIKNITPVFDLLYAVTTEGGNK